MNTTSKVIHLGIAIATLSALPANAFPRTGRTVAGVLQRVNHRQHTAEIATPDGTKPVTWTPRTKIWQGSQAVTADALRSGARVKVCRHVPLFGPPYMHRILLLGPKSNAKP